MTSDTGLTPHDAAEAMRFTAAWFPKSVELSKDVLDDLRAFYLNQPDLSAVKACIKRVAMNGRKGTLIEKIGEIRRACSEAKRERAAREEPETRAEAMLPASGLIVHGGFAAAVMLVELARLKKGTSNVSSSGGKPSGLARAILERIRLVDAQSGKAVGKLRQEDVTAKLMAMGFDPDEPAAALPPYRQGVPA